MNKRQTSLLSLSAALILGGAIAGCASSAPKPTGPLVIDGSIYKLLAAGGSLDGREVQFLERGDTIRGCLVSPGARLRDAVGVEPGITIFQLKKVKDNEWEGQYRAIDPGGGIAEKPVTVFFESNTLTWNLESATWERQEETNQLGEAEVARCTQ